MSVVRHMFYGSFGTQNSMVTFISKFDLRECQCQVKLGQFRLNFQIRNLLTTCLSCPDLSQKFKNVLHFHVRHLKWQALRFINVTSSLLPGFLVTEHPKIKALLSNFAYLLFVCILTTYIPVFGYLSFFSFIGNYIKKARFWVFGVKIKKIENSR